MSAIRRVVDQPCVGEGDLEAWIWQDVTARAQETLRAVLEASMQTELTLRLGYEPYQRDPQLHTNSRNGCYERDLDTQFGAIRGLRVPRPRKGKTEYRVLERYRRRAPWVDRLAQEMFLAGVSTRRVGPIMESLLEASVSASTVSRVAAGLQEQLHAWHRRPLCDDYQYLILDGVTMKVKGPSTTLKRSVLCVFGITYDGRRELIDYRIARGESERDWGLLLEDLLRLAKYSDIAKSGKSRPEPGKNAPVHCNSYMRDSIRARGLSGEKVQLAVTDGGQGLINALQFVFPRVPLQRCWAHKLRNVANQLKVAQREPCLKQAAGIYQAPHLREAIRRFRAWKHAWQAVAPKAVECLGKDIDSLLSFFRQPAAHWRKVRTTNAIERQFREVRRRTDPMTCFANEDSADRILFAIFTHANQRWAKSPLKEFTQKY